MAKWYWRGEEYAPVGTLEVTFKDGYTVKGIIQDCDGDFSTCVIYSAGQIIFENNNIYDIETDNNGPIIHSIDIAQSIVEDFVCRSILPVQGSTK